MSMSKQDRQNLILDFVAGNEIETQDELSELLVRSGVCVTQATISRDIRELKLIKTTCAKDATRMKYAVFSPVESNSIADKSRRILKDGVISVTCASNIVVIKTLEGLAMGVAASVDALEDPELVGTIAGDNTIFCVTRSNKRGLLFIKKLNSILKE